MPRQAAPTPAAPANPTDITVKISALRSSGPTLATASVDLNGVFAIRGVKVMNGTNGPFVSMPSYKTADGYKDICFPCTLGPSERFPAHVLTADLPPDLRQKTLKYVKYSCGFLPCQTTNLLANPHTLNHSEGPREFRAQFNDAVLSAYQQELSQVARQGQQAQYTPASTMTMK